METAQEKMYYLCCPKCGNRVHYGLPTKGSENKCTKCGAIVLTSITDDGKCTTQLRPKGRKLKAQEKII